MGCTSTYFQKHTQFYTIRLLPPEHLLESADMRYKESFPVLVRGRGRGKDVLVAVACFELRANVGAAVSNLPFAENPFFDCHQEQL